MSAKRLLSTTSIAGAAFLAELSASLKKVFDYSAGNAVNPTGVNAWSFDLDVEEGFAEHPDGMLVGVVAPATNTGAMTFEVSGPGLGTKPAVLNNGTAMSGGEVVSGTAYLFRFYGNEDEWRLQSPASRDTSSIPSKKTIYNNVVVFSVPGAASFTFPHRANYRISAFGPGGGGALHNAGRATGGTGGGTSIKEGEAESGLVLTLNIGAPGQGAAVDQNDGGDGTDTTVTATGISMTAPGGIGGVQQATGTAVGPTGPIGTGGDLNYRGGSPGDCTIRNGTAGGAAGLQRDGQSVDVDATGGAGLTETYTSTPAAAFIVTTLGNINAIGFKGGINSSTASISQGDPFCGGGGGSVGDDGGNGGIGAGGGGSSDTGNTGGDGGPGLIIIEYTNDLDA